MATLYELTQGYLELLEMAEDEETDQQMIEDTLESLEGEIEDKVEGCACVMKELEMQSEALDKEIRRLTARKKAIENNAGRIKGRIEDMMIITNNRKIKTAHFTFSIQKNPTSVALETDDFSRFPARFLVTKDPVISKTAILEALKNGEELPGLAHLEQKEGLRIR